MEMVLRSDAHGHDDVTVLVIFLAVFGAHVVGRLGIFEFEAEFAGVACLWIS